MVVRLVNLCPFVVQCPQMKIETVAVHAGHEVDPATGAVAAPIYLSTTFERDIEGTYSRGFMYSRNDNPNRKTLECGVTMLEGGEAAAFQQRIDERGDEDGLAGARQAGDAEPHGRVEQMAAEIGEGPRREPGLFDEVGDGRRHGGDSPGGNGAARMAR